MQYPGNRSWIEDHGRIWFFSVLKSLPLGWLCNSDKFFRLLQLKKSVSIYLELCKIWLLPGPVTFLLWASCNQLLYPRPLVPALTQTRPFAQPSHPPTLLWELTSVSMFAKRSSTLGSASYLLLDNNQNFAFFSRSQRSSYFLPHLCLAQPTSHHFPHYHLSKVFVHWLLHWFLFIFVSTFTPCY